MSAIDGKYVKINNQWKHEWGFVVKRAGCELRYKWRENVKWSQTRKFYF